MKRYCILPLLFIVCSCNPVHKQTQADTVIDVANMIALPFDSLKITSLQYIPLETNENVLIASINKMLVHNDRIYVADYNGAKALFVFDFQGKLIFSINRFGRGPGEYIQFADFNVTESGDIHVWDNGQRKLIKYGPDGSFSVSSR